MAGVMDTQTTIIWRASPSEPVRITFVVPSAEPRWDTEAKLWVEPTLHDRILTALKTIPEIIAHDRGVSPEGFTMPETFEWVLNDEPIPVRMYDAVVIENGAMAFDMTRARELIRDELRAARKPVLDDLDRLHNRSTGRGDHAGAAEIEARRERLRAITSHPSIEAAASVDELLAIDAAALVQEAST